MSVLLAVAAVAAEPQSKIVTWTGWFSDAGCGASRAVSGDFTPNNPECARACLEKGVGAVLISDQAKLVIPVTGYSAKDDLGYYVEVEGALDPSGKLLRIQRVKRLAVQASSCARPRKTPAPQ
jgi:hypothetical protein